MNHTHDVDGLPGDSKQSSVIAVQKMPVVRAQALVFSNQRVSLGKMLQGMELLFHLKDESIRVGGTVCGDEAPDRLNIHLGSPRDPNFESCGHA